MRAMKLPQPTSVLRLFLAMALCLPLWLSFQPAQAAAPTGYRRGDHHESQI